jgi:hypothetical protein
MFGWLADIRNYSMVEPIAARRGLPADLSEEMSVVESLTRDVSGHSWLSLSELLNFDYEATFEDRRSPDDVRVVFWFD